jgi:NUMOD4 motif/HNH endonuclease
VRWKPVPGYEGLYEVSTEGQVRSFRRRGTSGKVLSRGHAKRGGYLTVSLLRGCHQSTRPVHSLVLEAFVGPRPEGAEIRHLDGDPTNARLSNLAYGTRSENVLDKRRHGTDHNVAKTHCPQGHPYDEANTYVLPSRPHARYCRECSRRRSLARYHTSRARSDA